jgi:hypothetical protein
LRPLLSEVYRDVSYRLDEDGYADAEYRDEVRKRFVKSWEGLVSGYRVRRVVFLPSFLSFCALCEEVELMLYLASRTGRSH